MNPTNVGSIFAQASLGNLESLSSADSHINCLTPGNISAHRRHMSKRLPGSMLHPNFEPTPYSVIVGRGKEAKENPGNKRLHALATSYLQQYAQARTDKQIKTKIVSLIVSFVNETCPDGGSFIKRATNSQWYEVDNSIAREKAGYVFRDLLADKYRSSSKSKLARKHQQSSSNESVKYDGKRTANTKVGNTDEVATSSEEKTYGRRRNSSLMPLKSVFDMPLDHIYHQDSVPKPTTSTFNQSSIFDLRSDYKTSNESRHQSLFHDDDYDQLLNIPLLPFDDF